jgi:hypothetical protein
LSKDTAKKYREKQIPINLELQKLLEEARKYPMSPEEVEAQRQSWVRGEMALGTDADEERWKEEHGF